MLDLSKLTDQEAIVLGQAVDLMTEQADPATSDYMAINTIGQLSTALKAENSKRWRAANRPEPPRQHTLIVEVPADITDAQLRENGGIVAANLLFPPRPDGSPHEAKVQVEVVEHHFERMIEEPDGPWYIREEEGFFHVDNDDEHVTHGPLSYADAISERDRLNGRDDD